MNLETPLPLAQATPVAPGEAELWRQLRKAQNHEGYVAAWLALQARYIAPVLQGLVILGPADKGPFAPIATYPAGQDISTDLSLAAEAALTEKKGIMRDVSVDAVVDSQCVCLPLLIDEQLHGVVAFQIEARSKEALGQAARQLQWGVAWLESFIRRRSLLPHRQLTETLDFVALVLEAPRFSVALRSLVAEIANTLKADWVAVGLLDRRGLVELKSLSQSTKVSKKIELSRAIAAAMQEACDQRDILQVPDQAASVPLVTRAHEDMIDSFGAGSVITVPIVSDGTIIGAMTARKSPGENISSAERDMLRLTCTVVGPAIALKRRDDRWIITKLGIAVWQFLGRLLGPSHVWLKLNTLLLVAAAIYLSVGTATYKISAPATLEGDVQRAITVPIQGFLASSLVRPGDRVKAGQTLAKLDDRELQLEKGKLASEQDQVLREYRAALAKTDRSRMQVLKAQLEQTQARIDLLQEQLKRIDITSPFDGVILRGDVSQALGAPVQRGEVLFEIAPLQNFRVVIKVDESDINAVKLDQQGVLVLASAPTVEWPLRISRITPVSSVEDGHNAFRVEGVLSGGQDAVQPGMQGFAKITIAEQPILKVVTRRLTQKLRLLMWRWLP
jgi:RND family efflux transporter MFP subunit